MEPSTHRVPTGVGYGRLGIGPGCPPREHTRPVGSHRRPTPQGVGGGANNFGVEKFCPVLGSGACLFWCGATMATICRADLQLL